MISCGLELETYDAREKEICAVHMMEIFFVHKEISAGEEREIDAWKVKWIFAYYEVIFVLKVIEHTVVNAYGEGKWNVEVEICIASQKIQTVWVVSNTAS